MSWDVEEIRSPCVSICALNDKDICMGCFRSGEEITDWFSCGDEQKREILERAQERRKTSGPLILY